MRRPKTLSHPDEWIQVRRCHRCNETLQAKGARVQSCEHCGARFAPFYFADTTPQALLRRPRPRGLKVYRPLIGFEGWWSDSAPEVDRGSSRSDN